MTESDGKRLPDHLGNEHAFTGLRRRRGLAQPSQENVFGTEVLQTYGAYAMRPAFDDPWLPGRARGRTTPRQRGSRGRSGWSAPDAHQCWPDR